MGLLEGRLAIVTGGAKSIGKAFCEALAGEGANIVIADIEDGTATAQAIEQRYGVTAMAQTADVSDEDAVRTLVEAALERFSRIDILVNNAALFATMPRLPYDQIDVTLWDKVMAVNLRGVFLMAKHVGPHMRKANYGKIINIGSGTALKGVPDMLAYVTSKGGILGFTRALARELGPYNICVNTLAPGLTESESALAHPEHLEVQPAIIASRSIRRVEVPDDLTGALIFLASPMSDFMTGQTLAVDGGSAIT